MSSGRKLPHPGIRVIDGDGRAALEMICIVSADAISEAVELGEEADFGLGVVNWHFKFRKAQNPHLGRTSSH